MDMRSLALFAARLLVAQLFLLGGVQKWLDPVVVEDLLSRRGLPSWLAWPALAFNFAAGILLVLGIWTRPLAVLLAAYCEATSVFQPIPGDGWHMFIFVKNRDTAGDCLALAASGPEGWVLRPD